MNVWDVFTVIFSLAGLFFFACGSLGLLRFPEALIRLHALTKADNLGLGLIVISLIPQVASISDGLQLIIIWILVMLSGAVTSFLLASFILSHSSREVSDEQ